MGQYPSSPSASSSALSSTTSAVCPAASATSSISLQCPSVPLTTRSITYTITASEITATTTSYVTVPAAVTTITVTEDSTFLSYLANTTATYTTTANPLTVYTNLPADCTVTVPTPAGFTPVKCEATYINPYPASTYITIVVTQTGGTVVDSTVTTPTTSTITATEYTSTVTETTSYDVAYLAASYPITTSTISSSTSTIYDACGPSNVVAQHPRVSGFIWSAEPIAPAIQVNTFAISPVDCCGVCQGNSSCFGSAFRYGLNQPCALFLLDPNGSEQCNPAAVYGRLLLSDYGGEIQGPIVSNGRCGQLQFD